MPQRGAPQFGASLPHDRRRERPVGPGQFHSERRIRAGQVVPPGRCGFAMVRRSGGATARPLESIWASPPHDRRRERPVGPGQFHSERRIRAGRVVPPGRCGFAMVRRSGGATARPLDSIWSLSAAWSAPGEARRTGPCGPPGRCGFAMVRRSGGATARPLDSIWASLPHDRRRERPVGPGQFHSERRIRAGRVVPSGRCGFAMVRRSGGATARPLDSVWSLSAAWSAPGEARRTGPVSFREANQSGPCGASRAVRICHGAPQRGRNCPATGFDLGLSAAWSAPGEARRTGPVSFREANQSGPCGASRAVRICHGAPQRGRNCPATGFDLGLSAAWSAPGEARRTGPCGPPGRCGFAMVRRSGGATARPLDSIWASLPHDRRRERPVGPGQFHSERRIRAGQVVPPGRCGFAMVRRSGGATARPLESIWASLPHDRRRERPVGPGQFHSERRIRAGRVVPSGRCGFAMVRRSGGATARPLDSVWSLSAAWSAPGEARRTGPVSFREANQSGPCGASRAVRICHGAPQRGRNCPATGFDLGLSAA